jgi:hypothetical protein
MGAATVTGLMKFTVGSYMVTVFLLLVMVANFDQNGIPVTAMAAIMFCAAAFVSIVFTIALVIRSLRY